MYLGYNTNGFAHHRLDDALAILAELGYQGVALTVDHHVLNPFEPGWRREAERVRERLGQLGLRCVVETGARFLLDPRRKHQPTLLSATAEERDRRVRFLLDCAELSRLLGAEALSFWSGTPADDASTDILWQRLTDGCRALADGAEGVRLAFEPEPGMFVDTMTAFAALQERLQPSPLGLTLDVGHLHCLGETPIADQVRRWKDVLWNVHIEDMRRGVHDHLKFGEGDIAFPPVLAALAEVDYAGGVFVELSRHSHDAVRTARESLTFLRAVGARLGSSAALGEPGA
jgi:L-ribulose-5-phosphate 3-epimerase